MPRWPKIAVAGPEVEVVHAAGGVRAARGDVGAHQLRRDQLGGPAMHVLALQRVDAVRDPDPVRPLEHAEVDPGAAGGAGLDLQPGVRGLHLVDQPVEREGLLVHARAAVDGWVPASIRSRLWSHLM